MLNSRLRFKMPPGLWYYFNWRLYPTARHVFTHTILVSYNLLGAVQNYFGRGYYDVSVLSMSVMGFQKKVWMGVGEVRSIKVLFLFLEFNFSKPLNTATRNSAETASTILPVEDRGIGGNVFKGLVKTYEESA